MTTINNDDSMKPTVSVVPGSGDSITGRMDKDFTELDVNLNHIGLKADSNVVCFRRLGKSNSEW